MGLLRRFAPHNDRLKKCAFTLAELMITIGIVGVVAAITIPLLIQNSNYKKFTTQFRKSLSTLNQAAISAQAQYDMDYGMITSESTPSTCATDSLSGGQSTMCALLNNTLAGKTYMGVYGEVAGSMILTKYQFTKKTDGFDPANFLIYSMADGSIVGFNPSMKNCSLSGELTKSVLTDSNKLANCIGFIDVNGVSLPNKEVTCSDGTSALEPNNPCTLKSSGFGLGDVFPVVFHNGTVEPATNAAKAFFSGESSGAGEDNEIIIGYDSSGEPIKRERTKTINGKSYNYDADADKYYLKDSNGNILEVLELDGQRFVYNNGKLYDLTVTGRYSGYTYNYDRDLNKYVQKDSNGNITNVYSHTGSNLPYTKTVDGIKYTLNLDNELYYAEGASSILLGSNGEKYYKYSDNIYSKDGNTPTYYTSYYIAKDKQGNDYYMWCGTRPSYGYISCDSYNETERCNLSFNGTKYTKRCNNNVVETWQ